MLIFVALLQVTLHKRHSQGQNRTRSGAYQVRKWHLNCQHFKLLLLLLGRIAVLRTMRPIVTDPVEWSGGWSVCLSVCHSSEYWKNGWTDRDAVWY